MLAFKATSGAVPATVAKISELCRSLVLLPDDSSWTLVSTSVVDHCIAFRRNDQIMSSVLTRPHLRFAQGRRSALKFLLESLLMSLHPIFASFVAVIKAGSQTRGLNVHLMSDRAIIVQFIYILLAETNA